MKKRLQRSLEKELESYKYELNKDIEKYKKELNVVYDRKLSFSKNEIDTLKDLWSYFIESFYKFKSACSIGRIYTDISMMNIRELEEYFNATDYISDYNKKQILQAHDKQKELQKVLDITSLNEANRNLNECIMYLEKNSLFIPPNIKEKFDAMSEKMRLSMIRYDMHVTKNIQQFSGQDVYELLYNSSQEITALKTEVEKDIQKILFSENTFWKTDKN